MRLLTKLRQKALPIISGLCILGAAFWFETAPQPTISIVRDRLNSLIYDLRMQFSVIGKPPLKPSQTDIAIVDVNEQSLKEEGRWPWQRDKIAKLLQKLREDGAVVVAFDVVFAEPERNLADQILEELITEGVVNPKFSKDVRSYQKYLDNDQEFSDVIAEKNDVVLGFVLSDDPANVIGELPQPIMTLTPSEEERADLNQLPGQIANLPLLQKSAKKGGFVTTLTDGDGIIRHAPLVIEHGVGVYPSLGLAAVMQFYYLDNVGLNFVELDNALALTDITLGKKSIATDAFGQVLVPYRGPSHTFPYYSASDVLRDKVDPKLLENKIVFVGASAIGLGDLHATPFETSYPGVEIHATVADAIINHSFASVPDWSLGARVFALFVLGVLMAFLLPFLSLIWVIIVPTVIAFSIASLSIWLYNHMNIYISTISVYLMLAGVVMVNIIHALIFESRKRMQLKEMFGQYVPPAHVEKMSESNTKYSFEGESRDMSVLFADIRDFTKISESLEASQLKGLLNDYFTPMTKIIFDHSGTIDKYVGDMIMAFWGAPMENKNHALDAVLAGFAMLKMAEVMSNQFQNIGVDKIQIGVGINSGLMNVGDMGSTYRRSYTVLGDAVNLASRLESSTKFYHANFIISQNTLDGCHGEIIARHLDRVKVVGKEKAIEIYQPICLKSEATPEILSELSRQAAAEALYFEAKWDDAYQAYEELLADYPDCALYRIYAERIKELQSQGTVDPWDGCYVRVSK
uniref:Adenylate/guanylate cyclase with Chase sensor n=1 Tax=uncultured microorganism TaxID=358574 RepID=F8UGY5_9ZZZZ|nr:adenylate/guanylate cyclase with Chase sensor [uncultured microorganism]